MVTWSNFYHSGLSLSTWKDKIIPSVWFIDHKIWLIENHNKKSMQWVVTAQRLWSILLGLQKCNLSLQYETVCTVSVNRVDEIKVWDFILCKSIYHFSQVIFGENLVIEMKNVQYVTLHTFNPSYLRILGGLNCRNK